MRLHRTFLPLLALSVVAATANADFQFDTASTATQTITSTLVTGGSIPLNAAGTQHFTIDPVAGTASVTSAFTGSDFVTPFGTFSYTLYNTATNGTVTLSGGNYTIEFMLLFELQITGGGGGLLDGVTFETKDNAIFRGTVASLPFPSNSVFDDPNRPNDAVTIFLKSDPNGVLAANGVPLNSPVGTSSDRVVTTLRSVPEPSTLLLGALGAVLIGAFGLRKRMARRAA